MNAARVEDQPSLLKAAVALLVVRALLGLAAFAIPVEDEGERQTMLIVGAVFVALMLVLAYFVWNRKRWAGWAAIALMAVDILLSVPAFFARPGAAITVAAAVAVVLGVAVIVLLRHRTVWSVLR